jgi:hypothetical protein
MIRITRRLSAGDESAAAASDALPSTPMARRIFNLSPTRYQVFQMPIGQVGRTWKYQSCFRKTRRVLGPALFKPMRNLVHRGH